MLTRREMLSTAANLGAALALPRVARPADADETAGVAVNDVQSQLNATRVRRVVKPRSMDEVAAAVRDARRQRVAISVCGGRHSMGGQQFGRDTVLVDMTQFNRVVRLDREKGQVEVQAGIQWPELIDQLHRQQESQPRPWAIRQKQTGVDGVCLGGSLASNIHGRGLRFPPIIGDVESFVLVEAEGRVRTCSRTENAELFSLAIGGYGLFGIVVQVTLRLVPRTKLERVVEVIDRPGDRRGRSCRRAGLLPTRVGRDTASHPQATLRQRLGRAIPSGPYGQETGVCAVLAILLVHLRAGLLVRQEPACRQLR